MPQGPGRAPEALGGSGASPAGPRGAATAFAAPAEREPRGRLEHPKRGSGPGRISGAVPDRGPCGRGTQWSPSRAGQGRGPPPRRIRWQHHERFADLRRPHPPRQDLRQGPARGSPPGSSRPSPPTPSTSSTSSRSSPVAASCCAPWSPSRPRGGHRGRPAGHRAQLGRVMSMEAEIISGTGDNRPRGTAVRT